MGERIEITIGDSFAGAEIFIEETPYQVVELDLENSKACVRGPSGIVIKGTNTPCAIKPCFGVIKMGGRFEYIEDEYMKLTSEAALDFSLLKECECTGCVAKAVSYFESSYEVRPL